MVKLDDISPVCVSGSGREMSDVSPPRLLPDSFSAPRLFPLSLIWGSGGTKKSSFPSAAALPTTTMQEEEGFWPPFALEVMGRGRKKGTEEGESGWNGISLWNRRGERSSFFRALFFSPPLSTAVRLSVTEQTGGRKGMCT